MIVIIVFVLQNESYPILFSTDAHIDKYCRDADVFVLVLSSEGVMNRREKEFLSDVVSGRPNLFVLYNRWDASDEHDPTTVELIRTQHLDRVKEFISEEINCMSAEEVDERTFFVSALETMKERSEAASKRKEKEEEDLSIDPPSFSLSLEEDGDWDTTAGGSGSSNGAPSPKDARREEFRDFENKLKECLCKSAVKTKFQAHTLQGVDTTRDINQTMETILTKITQRTNACEDKINELQKSRNTTIDNFRNYFESVQQRLRKFRANIENDLSAEIKKATEKVEQLVDSFPLLFQGQPQYVKYYKEQLEQHIQKGLDGAKLKIRCSSHLLESVENFRKEIHEEIFQIVPETSQQLCTNMSHVGLIKPTPEHPLPVSYECEIPNIFNRFQEDISFHFSLGWRTVVGKFLMPRNPRLALLLGTHPCGYDGVIKKWRSKRLAVDCSSQIGGSPEV